MQSIAAEIGERIRLYRMKKNWTQADLAERSESNISHIGSIERGEKVPTVDTIYKFCQALDLPLETLFENLIPGNPPTEIPTKFYNLINELPEKEQKVLYDLLQHIIQVIRNHID